LPPGYALTYNRGELRIWSYWDFHLEQSEGRPDQAPFKDVAASFRDVLKEAVRQEMVSDVPLGIFLSGGVDSSALAALAAEINPGQVKTFSITFEDASFDESRFARLTANHLGTQHHEMALTSQVALDIIPRIAMFMDEPLADSSIVPTMLLCEFARQHVTVALGGDGGDEMLAGYSTLQAHRLMEMYASAVPGTLRRVIQQAVKRLPTSFNDLSLDFKLKRFTDGHALPPEIRHQTWLGSFDTKLKHSILQKPYIRPSHETYDVVFRHWAQTVAQNPLNKVLYLDMKMYLDGDILSKVDRASMSHSLEVRVPFLNLELLRFLECVPIDYKLQFMTTKSLLRRAMQNDLPREILLRGKKGFNIPVARWLTTDLHDWAYDLLAPERLQRQGIFNSKAVQNMLQNHMSRRQDMRKHLWTLLMFQTWWDQWLAS
jgi:asparagine synthase (glutamine-hydrolysing)